MFVALMLVRVIAAVFLPWYDDPEYYTETYGIKGLFGVEPKDAEADVI